jgi:hypothetical protein
MNLRVQCWGIDLAYYSPADLRRAFGSLTVDSIKFEGGGTELSWGRKP